MRKKIIEVKYDPNGDGCLRIEQELLSWGDSNLEIHIREVLQKHHATHVRQVGDVYDGEVITTQEFLKQVEVFSHGFR